MKSYAAEPTGGKPVVGEGPFRLVKGTADGSTFKFTANPNYWGGTPHIDEVDFQFYKNDDSAVQALKKGEADFVYNINALEVKSLEGAAGVTAHNGDSPGFDEVAFNTGSIDTKTKQPIGNPNPAVKDPKFRHALGYAFNLPQLISKVYQGAGLPGSTIIPPAYPTYQWKPPASQAFTYDPAKAAALLDAAGYTKGSDGSRNLPNGQPIGTLRLAARSDSPTSLHTMDFVKGWLSAVGIKSEISTYSSSQLTDVILKGNFDAFQWGWFVEPDPDSMLSNMTCGQLGGSSDSWFCNKQYDALYQKQHTETDDTARAAEVKKMQQILFAQSPYLVTAYSAIGEAVRSDRFACFVPQPNPGGVWIEQYGVYNYVHAKPAADAGTCDTATTTAGDNITGAVQATTGDSSSSSASTGFLIGAGVVVLVLALGGGAFAVRRRATAGDRE
jgi:peptide/nickel transport system substrate-binding protein